MTAIVLASGNRGKLAEFAQLLAPYGVTMLPQDRFVESGAEETGATFEENAILKARYVAQATGLPAIADDSGLEVDALGGAPGVRSARFAGPGASDGDNLQKLLAALAQVPDQQRTARFRCVLAYVNAPNEQPVLARGVWPGRILSAPRGSGGFGYDPIFLPDGATLSAAELSSAEKHLRSHRGQALRALARLLKTHGYLNA